LIEFKGSKLGQMRQTIPSLTLLSLVFEAASLCSAAPITYNVDLPFGAASVTGTITTDGMIGVLSSPNILNWNLVLNDRTKLCGEPVAVVCTVNLLGPNGSAGGAGGGGGHIASADGADLSATATQLLFNFGGSDNGEFLIGDGVLGAVCFGPTGCLFGPALGGAGESLYMNPPGSIEIPNNGEDFQFTSVSGTRVIGTTAKNSPYTFTDIYDPLAPPFGTMAYGINNAGQIVGQYGDATCNCTRGFLFSGGTFTTVNGPLGVPFAASGINDTGQIVGYPGLDNGGTFTAILDPLSAGYPGAGAFTTSYGINNSGQIVGRYVSEGSGYHGFLDSGGTFTTIDDPLSNCLPANCAVGSSPFNTVAQGINNSGQIVGYYSDGSIYHGFLYSSGAFTNIDYPSAASPGTFAEGINDAGQIVGYYFDGFGDYHGFLDSGGIFITVDDPLGVEGPSGGASTYAYGINNAGAIVGVYRSSGIGGFHGFLATPTATMVPPSQVSTSASGLVYSRVTQTFNGTVTIKNISAAAINGPLLALFTSLTSGVMLTDATNSFGGWPYLTVSAAASLAPGQAVTVGVQFKDPSNAAINFKPVIYSGSIN